MSGLAKYAADPSKSIGRLIKEQSSAERTEFQRDRDRVVHSTSFRRLEYKTQVFVNHEGDLFRTRLTHSIEVAQIARSIARSLNINEDLVEAISLAHDLGHTPFGHSGQDALNECMKGHGGFEHNFQSLRVVDLLEKRYGNFDGLNLCYETREGILKHCSKSKAQDLGAIGKRFIDNTQPSLEAQLANLADEIAYNNHDVDDGLRSGLLKLDQLLEVDIFKRNFAVVHKKFPRINERRLVNETVRRVINELVTNLTQQTRKNIKEIKPSSIEEVRLSRPLVGFSDDIKKDQINLKRFLRTNLYSHYRVRRMSQKAKKVVKELFYAFETDPKLLPIDHQPVNKEAGARPIADYIAGMTDRYAMLEYRRLFRLEDV